ncbi:MAG: extracellular solute-binding protein [Halanaerobiales bacterium]
MKKKVFVGLLALVFMFNIFVLNGQVVMAEEVTISFMHFYSEAETDSYSIVFNEILNEFQKNNPQYNIKQEVLSHDNYEMKIKTLAAANELPDVFLIKGSMIDNFRASGMIGPFDSFLAADPEWKDSFVQGAFSDAQRDEGIFGIPLKVEPTSLLFYNEAIFKEAGVDEFPETWEEFIVAINKIKEAGYTPISLGNKGKWVAQSCILSMLGDRYTGTDWFRSIRNNTGASFNDSEFVAALAALQELAEMGAFNGDMNSIDNNQQRTAFYNGEAAMFFEGAWALNVLEENAPEEILANTRVEILPAVQGGKGNPDTFAGGAAWSHQINSSLEGAEREAAIELIKALTSQEFSTKLIENNGTPPTKPGDYDKSKLTKLMNDYFALLDRTNFSPTYDVQLSPSIIEVMNSGLQELLIGVLSPEDLAERIQDEYERN